MKCNYKPKVTGEITLYDMNCSMMSQLPPLEEDALTTAKTGIIKEFVDNYSLKQGKVYYMLLCKELSYFTLFNMTGNHYVNLIEDELIECLKNVGDILDISKNEDGTALECWVKDKEKTTHCFHFFPYDEGVIECG